MSTMTGKQRYHAALVGRPVDRTPCTPIIMAWGAHLAGRSYRDFYLDHRVMVEANRALVRDFGIDQVSSISDPWRESTAFGLQLDWPEEGVGIPKFHFSDEQIRALQPFDPMACERTHDRIDAVRILAGEFGGTHSVLGWVEGPLANYTDLRGVDVGLTDLLEAPDQFATAAEVFVRSAEAFAQAQIAAGADVIGVGDAACSLIGPQLYEEYLLAWHKKLFASIHAAGAKVKLHICGNITSILELMSQTGADVIDVDWMVPLTRARAATGDRVALAGNLNPADVILQGTPDQVRAGAQACIRDGGPRFVLQPGCEVPPGTPTENLHALMEAARAGAGCITAG